MKFTTISATLLMATSMLVAGYCNLAQADQKTTEAPLTQDQIVNIPDLNLRKALNQSLGKDDKSEITSIELSSLTSLNLDNKNISSIEGLQYCTNLNRLVIGHDEEQGGGRETNTISNLTPLASLPNLKILICGDLHVTDFSSLNKLNLEFCDTVNHDKSYLGLQHAEIDQTSDTPDGIVIKNPFINMDGSPMPIAITDRKVKNITYMGGSSLIQFDQFIQTDSLAYLAKLALQGYNLVDCFGMSSSGKNSNESLIYGGGTLRVKLRIRSTCEILNQELDDRIARKKTTSHEEFASLVNKITNLRGYLSKNQIAEFQEKLLNLCALLDHKKLDWRWNKEGDTITLLEYIGKNRNVVIPTAKDLGFDGLTIEIDSDALKKAAEGAQTISTSNNGAQIKLKGDSLQNLFSNNKTIEKVSLNNLDTSNITNMESAFAFCQKLNSIQIGDWNVSNVTNMHDMFWYCTNLVDIDLNKWDTSNVTNMDLMFDACVSLKILDIKNWNVEKVTTMNHMFFCCEELESLDLGKWNVSNVSNMTFLFYGCQKLNYLDLNNWKINKTTKVDELFVTESPKPLLVRTTDERLKTYNYAKDNRCRFGILKIDSQYGSFNGQQTVSLFDYTTEQTLSENLIESQLSKKQNNLSLKNNAHFEQWSLEGHPNSMLDKAQGVYNAHVSIL